MTEKKITSSAPSHIDAREALVKFLSEVEEPNSTTSPDIFEYMQGRYDLAREILEKLGAIQ